MFNPSLPADATKATAAEMRAQLTGLKDLIDAVPGLSGVVVDSVTTLNPGDAATASASLAGTVLHLSFGLPQGATGTQGLPGNDGATGPQGAQGAQGIQGLPGNDGSQGTAGQQGPPGEAGPQGVPGEVTNAALASAIAGTSANTNGVGWLSLTVSDPPTHTEVQLIANKLDELITALRR